MSIASNIIYRNGQHGPFVAPTDPRATLKLLYAQHTDHIGSTCMLFSKYLPWYRRQSNINRFPILATILLIRKVIEFLYAELSFSFPFPLATIPLWGRLFSYDIAVIPLLCSFAPLYEKVS